MHRPRPTFWIATATVAALALGGGVAAARDGDASHVTRHRSTRVDSAKGSDDTATTTTTAVPAAPAVAPPVTEGGPGNPWVEDHGADDPATHDVGDDHGVDDPATHDVGDDHGVDDPATHDVGDDHSGPNRGPGSGDSGSGDSGSGHDNSGHDGPGPG